MAVLLRWMKEGKRSWNLIVSQPLEQTASHGRKFCLWSVILLLRLCSEQSRGKRSPVRSFASRRENRLGASFLTCNQISLFSASDWLIGLALLPLRNVLPAKNASRLRLSS